MDHESPESQVAEEVSMIREADALSILDTARVALSVYDATRPTPTERNTPAATFARGRDQGERLILCSIAASCGVTGPEWYAELRQLVGFGCEPQCMKAAGHPGKCETDGRPADYPPETTVAGLFGHDGR